MAASFKRCELTDKPQYQQKTVFVLLAALQQQMQRLGEISGYSLPLLLTFVLQAIPQGLRAIKI